MAAVPFPNFNNGVGLMLQLPNPTKLASVTVNLDSTGTEIQIRSAKSQSPASLDDTTALTAPTRSNPAPTRSPSTTPPPDRSVPNPAGGNVAGQGAGRKVRVGTTPAG